MAPKVKRIMTQPIVSDVAPCEAPPPPAAWSRRCSLGPQPLETDPNTPGRGALCDAACLLPPRAAPSPHARLPLQNLIFRFLQSRQKIQIWLFDHNDMRVEGRLIGFDEYMNLVLDEAEEVSVKRQTRKPLGRILLKGDNITLMRGL